MITSLLMWLTDGYIAPLTICKCSAWNFKMVKHQFFQTRYEEIDDIWRRETLHENFHFSYLAAKDGVLYEL